MPIEKDGRERLHENGAPLGSLRPTVVLAVAVLVAILVRLPFISERSIWYDEASSWQTAKFPLTNLWDSLSRNVHLPLYYLVLKAWMLCFGEHLLSMRSLSLGLGALTVALIWKLGREVEPGQEKGQDLFVPIACSFAIALNAFQVNASIEARMYSLGTALAVCCAIALARVLKNPVCRKHWWFFVASCALLAYTHHHCLLVLSSSLIILTWHLLFSQSLDLDARKLIRRRLAISVVALSLIYIPGALLLGAQISRVRQNYWTAPISWPLVSSTFVEFISPLLRRTWCEREIGILSFVAVTFSCLIIASRGRKIELMIAAMGVLPMLQALLLSTWVTPIWEGRFFRFCQPFLVMSVVIAIKSLLSHCTLKRLTAISVLLTGFAIATTHFWTARQIPSRQGMKGVFDEISVGKLSSRILCTSNIHYFPAKYYLGNRVMILRSATTEFWGDHLIRKADIASPHDVQNALNDGCWVLSHQSSSRAKELEHAKSERSFQVDYECGVPDWAIVVTFMRSGEPISLNGELGPIRPNSDKGD